MTQPPIYSRIDCDLVRALDRIEKAVERASYTRDDYEADLADMKHSDREAN